MERLCGRQQVRTTSYALCTQVFFLLSSATCTCTRYRPLPGYAILGFLLWKQVTCDLLVGKTARQRLSFSMFLIVLKTTFSFVTHLLLLFVGKKISDTCRVRRWRRMASDAASIVSEGPVQPMKPLGLPDALSVLAHGLAKGSANSADEIADLNKSLLALRVAELKSIAKHLNVRLTGASKKSEIVERLMAMSLIDAMRKDGESDSLYVSHSLGEACNHVAALLFYLEDASTKGLTELPAELSKTSLPMQWNQPPKKTVPSHCVSWRLRRRLMVQIFLMQIWRSVASERNLIHVPLVTDKYPMRV